MQQGVTVGRQMASNPLLLLAHPLTITPFLATRQVRPLVMRRGRTRWSGSACLPSRWAPRADSAVLFLDSLQGSASARRG